MASIGDDMKFLGGFIRIITYDGKEVASLYCEKMECGFDNIKLFDTR
jgi:hypothetical protein